MQGRRRKSSREAGEDPFVQSLVRDLLKELGEDPHREGLWQTPERVAKAFRYLTSGYGKDLSEILNGAIFTEEYDEMVLVKDIDIFSLCEHHLLPFFGKCHVAYIPKKKIIGLSKVVRLVEMYSRRLQVQERLTQQIAQTLKRAVQPRGVGVVIEAYHFCMMMRGVEKQSSKAVTSAMLGTFQTRPEIRNEFVQLIK
ncbi:MAG: GTP cyclohydrolase I FolE [candidate division NC10 bacterium]|nr:GTP cyclohydrolase I FolE [candidate division NC10 bacterium]